MEKLETQVEIKKEKAKRKPKISIVRILVALLIVLSFVGGFFTRHFIASKDVRTTSEIISIIEKYAYVVDENGNQTTLNEQDYANALINGLNDDYARYYTKEEYEKIKNQQKGNYSGFGISIDLQNEYPEIISVVGNSPAEQAGAQVGDIIISASVGENQTQINSENVSEYLSGIEKDTMVEFEILRKGQQLSIEITKSSYKATYVKYYDSESEATFDFENKNFARKEGGELEVDDNTALIELSSFEGDVSYQFSKALDFMYTNERTKLILDLRDNGGGYMDDLTAVSKHLIYNEGQKTLIAIAKGNSSSEKFYMHGPIPRDNIEDVVVLANKNTASASECLIGAMLYYGEKNGEKNFSKERLIIETDGKGSKTTYGKGIMQTTYLLSNGGAFKLTTARILWPDNQTCIHGRGIDNEEYPENVVEKSQVISRARELLS